MIELHCPAQNEEVSLQKEYQKMFREHVELALVPKFLPMFGIPSPGSDPNPVHFEWSGDTSAEFQLSDAPDFSNILYRTSGCNEYDVFNLQIGRTYYWRVGDSEVRTFHTLHELPRYILVEGLGNVRDIGGYDTVYGRRVKQGLIYRSMKLEPIREEGKKRLVEDLGIRCDFDLRLAGEGGFGHHSPLGDKVKYIKITTDSYVRVLDNHAHWALLLRYFANHAVLPLIFHCAGGTDRTGTVAAILLGVLGVSDEDILQDYEATSMEEGGSVSRYNHDNNARGFFNTLRDHYFGDTIHESICNIMRLSGVTDAEMDAFRERMLEPAR